MMLASCGGGVPEAKSIEDVAPKTGNDSLSYYYGQMAAMQYQQMAAQDSALKTEAGKKAFLEGYAKTIAAAEGKDEAYISGMLMALQMQIQKKQIKKELDFDINTTLAGQALAFALKNDSVSNSTNGMNYVNNKLMQLQKVKTDKSSAEAAKKLSALGSKGFKNVGKNIAARTVTPGTGAQVKVADRLKVHIRATDVEGKNLNVPMPSEIEVGQTFGPDSPLTEAIKTMKIGETSAFAIPAAAIFNGGQSQFGLGDTDLVVFEVKIEGEAPAKAAAKAAQPAAAAPADAAPADKK